MICLMITCYNVIIQAQTLSSEDNKLRNKAQKLKEKKKYSDAIEIYKELSVKYYLEAEIWDEFFEIAYNNYLSNPGLGNFTITAKSPEGEILEDDSLLVMFKNMLGKITPENTLREVCRASTMLGVANYRHDIFLRTSLTEPNTNEDIPSKAMAFYNKAETFFASGNYKSAADNYKKAINEHPDFFKAMLYLGDVYYMTEQYDLAIESFKACHEKFPNFSEPIKFLSDAYYKYGAYDAAYDAAITGMMVYPDMNMKQKLEQYSSQVGKSIRFSPLTRYVLPNSTIDKSIDWLQLEKVDYWEAYQNAFEDIKKHTNQKGIIEKNDVTLYELSEVYCWNKMLEAFPDHPLLEEAREMKAKGFLDCYVLIDNYHVDLFDQFRYLVEKDPEHVKAYFAYLSKKS